MPAWVFCRAKDTRNLLKVTQKILVVDFLGQIRFNFLLPPPGLDFRFWINCFADSFIQAFGLYDGTKNFLLEQLDRLFCRKQAPTIRDLYGLIKGLKFPGLSRFARYQESALNRLGGLISSMGETLDYPLVPLEELVNRHIIFEIQKLTSELQVFIVNILLNWLFCYKIYHDGSLIHLVGIDDANLLFDRSFENRPDRGLPIISHLVATVRKAKVFMIVLSQIPHQLGASIHSNAFTKIAFSLANGKDIDCIAQSIGIREREQLKYLHGLSKREIIVKFAGRHQEPFLAYVPEIRSPDAEISDEEVRCNNERMLSAMTLIAEPDGSEETSRASESEQGKENGVSAEEKAFLWDVYNRPYVSITERYDTIELGG